MNFIKQYQIILVPSFIIFCAILISLGILLQGSNTPPKALPEDNPPESELAKPLIDLESLDVDELTHLGGDYYTDNEQVFFIAEHPSSNGVLEGADPKTFKGYKVDGKPRNFSTRSYGIDKNNVYILTQKFTQFDLETFRFLFYQLGFYFGDSAHVYEIETFPYSSSVEIKIVPDIDPKTVRALPRRTGNLIYVVDENNVYRRQDFNSYKKIPGADPKTFKEVKVADNVYVYADKNYVYVNLEPMKGIDIPSLQLLGKTDSGYILRDSKQVFMYRSTDVDYLKPLPSLDPNTTEVFQYYVKDSNQVLKLFDLQDSGLDPLIFEKLIGADPESFDVFYAIPPNRYSLGEYVYADKNRLYLDHYRTCGDYSCEELIKKINFAEVELIKEPVAYLKDADTILILSDPHGQSFHGDLPAHVLEGVDVNTFEIIGRCYSSGLSSFFAKDSKNIYIGESTYLEILDLDLAETEFFARDGQTRFAKDKNNVYQCGYLLEISPEEFDPSEMQWIPRGI